MMPEATSAAPRIGVEMITKYGRDTVLSAIEEYLDDSERALRESLRIPEGTYAASDYIDGNGHEERSFKIAVALTVRAGGVYVDFTGTDRRLEARSTASSRPRCRWS